MSILYYIKVFREMREVRAINKRLGMTLSDEDIAQNQRYIDDWREEHGNQAKTQFKSDARKYSAECRANAKKAIGRIFRGR